MRRRGFSSLEMCVFLLLMVVMFLAMGTLLVEVAQQQEQTQECLKATTSEWYEVVRHEDSIGLREYQIVKCGTCSPSLAED